MKHEKIVRSMADILKEVQSCFFLSYVNLKQLFEIRNEFYNVIRVHYYMYYFKRIFNGDQ